MKPSHLAIMSGSSNAITEKLNARHTMNVLDLRRNKDELNEDIINDKMSDTASLSCSSEAGEEIERRSSVHVNFTKLEIREYELQLGDNPAVRKGPPISIGWDVVDCFEHDLGKYEFAGGTEFLCADYHHRQITLI